jgi:chitodextrinase
MKNIPRKLFFIACIQGLLGTQHAYAATYYVSPTGVDINSGTSLSLPVRTINKALSKASSSGDIVYVMTGTYAETVSIGQSGITLSAYPNNNPIIDGGTTLPSGDWGALIYVAGNNNAISGFEVKNSNITGTHVGGYGIQVVGHHNTINKMNIHHIWEQGGIIQGDYNIVEDSSVWQASRHNSVNPGSVTWGTGLSAARNRSAAAIKPGITSYAILRRNKVFNNWGEGLSCFEADYCTMEDNIVYDNWTQNIYISDTTNSLVQRNVVYVSSQPAIPTRNNSHPGLTLADEVASVPPSANNTIINNFIYNTGIQAFSWTLVANSGLKNVLIAYNTIVDGDLITGTGGGYNIVNTNSQVRNNVILGTHSSVPNKNGITFSNNNWGMTPPLAAAVTDIVGDPQIARTGTTTPGTLTPVYFTISASSPMINAATPLNNVTSDFFQFIRGATPDIGGHEFNVNNTRTIDSIAPSSPSGLSTAIVSSKVNLAWNASTDNVSVAGYIIYRNGTEIGRSTATSFADTSVIGGTTYNYTIKAYDNAGNFSVSSNTATVNIPLTPVVNITSNYAGNITTSSAQINWTTNVPTTAVISYSVLSAYKATNDLGLHVTVTSSATSQSVVLPGLYTDAQYWYKITAKSGSATATSSTSTFTTLKKIGK